MSALCSIQRLCLFKPPHSSVHHVLLGDRHDLDGVRQELCGIAGVRNTFFGQFLSTLILGSAAHAYSSVSLR